VSETTLLELRLFGPESEILIWRSDAGWAGRRITDVPLTGQNLALQPAEEDRVLLGDRLRQAKDGFTRVRTAAGAEQAVPIECDEASFGNGPGPLRLKVRNYFQQDQETGVVRVAASRLVNVFMEAAQ
jgi:CRISPR-associated protein (TIGR03984 family)